MQPSFGFDTKKLIRTKIVDLFLPFFLRINCKEGSDIEVNNYLLNISYKGPVQKLDHSNNKQISTLFLKTRQLKQDLGRIRLASKY